MNRLDDEQPPLRIRVRPGAYSCGTETIEQILRAALAVLADEGASAFTLRRIGAKCGMKVGNLSYYFPRKENLVEELLEAILNGYTDLAAIMLQDVSDDPEERLSRIIDFTLEDVRSKRTTNLFPELWALANHDVRVNELVQSFYARVHARIAETVKRINPALSNDESLTLAMFISACMEGTTIFAGHGKSWVAHMPVIKTLAIKSLLNLAKTVTPEELRLKKRRAKAVTQMSGSSDYGARRTMKEPRSTADVARVDS